MGKYIKEGNKISFIEEYFHPRIGTESIIKFSVTKEEITKLIKDYEKNLLNVEREYKKNPEDNFIFSKLDNAYTDLKTFQRALLMFNIDKMEMTDQEFSEIEEDEE